MTDIVIELLRALVVGGIVFTLLRVGQAEKLSKISGWRTFVTGFVLIFFGTLIDITDNFTELNRFTVIGDTEVQAFLEKVVGYLMGFLLLALGIWRWLPKLVEHEKLTREKHQLEVEEERMKVFRATMRTVHDIVNNFLNNLLLFKMEAEDTNALKPESLALMESIIEDTSGKLKKLAALDTTPEKQMAGGNGIDYEKSKPVAVN